MSSTQLNLTPQGQAVRQSSGALLRTVVIALTAFLTVVDLFATQAILPALAARYGVSPAAMGTAVNATTLGMAASSLGVALLSRRIDRRRGILASLALLAIPTALLASAPDLASFTALRVTQGVFMAAAFTLTLAHLGERCGAAEAAGAFAAYVTGNVASNLVGRLASAALADHLGLAGSFYGFALLNLAGAVLVFFTLGRTPPMPNTAAVHAPGTPMQMEEMSAWAGHLRSPPLRASFGIGFCILFAFIGTFTYVSFVLAGEPFGLGMMALGLVHLVFLPSVLTTSMAGRLVRRFGTRPALWGALAVAAAGLPMLLAPSLPVLLTGLVLVGAGTFLAQATATGFVGRAATGDRAAASGTYLACYFGGGLVGSAALGRAYEALGWGGCVAGVGLALAAAALLAPCLDPPAPAEKPALADVH
jgi:predicted MFS family arabinose efflux permease